MDRALLKIVPSVSKACHLVDDRCRRRDGGGFPIERDYVSAHDDPAIELGFKPPQYYVPRAAECARRFVRQLNRLPHQPLRASWAMAETRLPSAWPATLAIAAFITCPVSFALSAPVSAIAPATISRS